MNIEKINLLISFATYPRDGIATYGLLEKTFNSLIAEQDLTNFNIKIIVVGDDYQNLDELKPIFKGFDCEFYNININNALRNMENVPKLIKWSHAVQRSKIFILEKALNLDYDYILMSADDELYLNKKIETSFEYIKKYNYPDFVFNLGKHYTGKIIPQYNNINSFPESCNCISSGCIYKLKNKDFINEIIKFRKSSWKNLEILIKKNKNYVFKGIKPEDAELWDFLEKYFINKKYTSILIPIVLIDHYSEKTLFTYIK
jgi:hypothetical protein